MFPQQRDTAMDRLGSLQRIANIHEENHDVYLSTGGFMEEFFEKVDEILCKIDHVHDLNEELEDKYSLITTSTNSERGLEQQAEEQVHTMQRHLRESNVLIKGIETEIENCSKQTAEHRVKKMQHLYLSWYLRKTVEKFINTQIKHKEKVKEMLKRETEITEQKCSDEQIDEMIENGNISIFTSNIIIETEKAKQDLELIVDRHNHILQIEKSLRELHEMFQDLAIFVESQGEMLDNIERNVVETVEFITSGGKHLKSARNYRDKSRKMKFYCVGCCLILLVIIAIILLIKFA